MQETGPQPAAEGEGQAVEEGWTRAIGLADLPEAEAVRVDLGDDVLFLYRTAERIALSNQCTRRRTAEPGTRAEAGPSAHRYLPGPRQHLSSGRRPGAARPGVAARARVRDAGERRRGRGPPARPSRAVRLVSGLRSRPGPTRDTEPGGDPDDGAGPLAGQHDGDQHGHLAQRGHASRCRLGGTRTGRGRRRRRPTAMIRPGAERPAEPGWTRSGRWPP